MRIFDVEWTYFKQFVADKSLLVQYIQGVDRYHILAFDEFYGIQCDLMMDSGADTVDFETNYKNEANKSLGYKRDADGAQIVNPKLASNNRKYQSHFACVTLGKFNSLVAKDENNDNVTFFVQKLYKKVSGEWVEITDAGEEGLAEMTTLEWEPNISYDIQGFTVSQKTQPEYDIFLSAIAAWHLSAFGLSVVSVKGCNLAMAPFGNREMDWVGDSATSVDKDVQYNSHHQIMRAFHPQNTNHRIMAEIIWYI